MELFPGAKLGRYEIVRRLSAGGMAEVYAAHTTGTHGFRRLVALKRMLPELALEPGFREMFVQEASLAANLDHPNLVRVFDFAEEEGELYLAMEFVHGVNLRELILKASAMGRGGEGEPLQMPPLLVASIGAKVARGLAHAWEVPGPSGAPLHLIHRDVSPQNVLLSYTGGVLLTDFGIARPAERHTDAGVLKGKLHYMSPEQISGAPLDARSDIFSLGVTLYEAARTMARPAFDAADRSSIQQAVISRNLPPPHRMDDAFPRSLSEVLMRALERDPNARYQSAEAFAEALEEALHRDAKGPADSDVASFLKRILGTPPPAPLLAPSLETAQHRPNARPARWRRPLLLAAALLSLAALALLLQNFFKTPEELRAPVAQERPTPSAATDLGVVAEAVVMDEVPQRGADEGEPVVPAQEPDQELRAEQALSEERGESREAPTGQLTVMIRPWGTVRAEVAPGRVGPLFEASPKATLTLPAGRRLLYLQVAGGEIVKRRVLVKAGKSTVISEPPEESPRR